MNGTQASTAIAVSGTGLLNLGASNLLSNGASLSVSGGNFNIATFNNTLAGVQLTGGTIAGTTGILTSTSAFDMENGTVTAKLGGTAGLTKTTQLHGLRPRPSRRLRWLGQGGRRRLELPRRPPVFQEERGARPQRRDRDRRVRHNTSGPLGVLVRSPVLSAARDFVQAARRRAFRGRLQRTRPPESAGSRLTFSDDDPRRQTHEHLSRFSRRCDRTTAEPRLVTCPMPAASCSKARPARRGRSASITARPTANYAEAGDQGGRAVRRSRRFAAVAAPLGHRPSCRTRGLGIACEVDSPHVGKHLKDHLEVALFFPAPRVGVSMNDVGLAFGPDALRARPAHCRPTAATMPAYLPNSPP